MIQVDAAEKFFGDFQAVKGISFTINKGEITGLLGPNGAGKTTTLRMLTGYFMPDGGSISIDGILTVEESVETRKKIGYLPESAPLYEEMIVLDYLQYVAQIHGIKEEKRIEETASLCGITGVLHKTIGELSKGYRQRVGLAHALLHDPEILILDEPTTGLDPNQIVEIRKLIREIGKTKTIILSTHILSEVEATCDRVIIINEGSVVADDSMKNLQALSGDSHVVTASCSGVTPEELGQSLSSLEGVSLMESGQEGELATVKVSARGRDMRPEIFRMACEKQWTLYELSRQQESLEYVFRQLTGGQSNELN